MGFGCQGDVLGLSLPTILCSQCDLKIGAGRIYFKYFLVFAGVISMMVFLQTVGYILGMRHRDRFHFRQGFHTILTQEMLDLLGKLHKKSYLQTLENQCNFLLEKQVQVISKIIDKSAGKQ